MRAGVRASAGECRRARQAASGARAHLEVLAIRGVLTLELLLMRLHELDNLGQVLPLLDKLHAPARALRDLVGGGAQEGLAIALGDARLLEELKHALHACSRLVLGVRLALAQELLHALL